MTKKALVELLQERLGGVEGRDYQTVEGYASLAWQQIMVDIYRNDPNKLDFYAKEFSGANKLSLTLDPTRNRYYASMPCPVVQLPNETAAVRTISTEQGDSLEFCPITERVMKLKAYQTSNILDGMCYYRVYYNKIWFDENMTDLIADYGVRALIVPAFEYYGETEQIPIPGGQAKIFIDMVVAIAKGTPPPDMLNDNVPE